VTSPTVSAVGRARRLLGAAAALSAVLTLTGCGSDASGAGGGTGAEPLVSGMEVHDDDGMAGAVLERQYVMPDTALTATDRRAYSLTEDTTRPLTLVFFGYTHCPDICQIVMSDIASSMTRLDPADRDKVAMLFITSDPARDKPEVLREYLDRFDPAFEGLTGDLDRIVEVANTLGVAIEKGAKMPSGGYEVAHGTQIVGVDAQDRASIVWTEGTSAADLAADITTIVHDNG
jgi:protein SCO1